MNIKMIESMSGESAKTIQIIVEVVRVKEVEPRSGSTIAFVEIRDSSGELECIVFPEVYRSYKSVFYEGAKVEIEGRVNLAENPRKLFPSKATICT